MKAQRLQLILALAVLFVGACQQDPFRLRTYSDTGPLPDRGPDLGVPPDGPRPPTDAKLEAPKGDLSHDACKAIPEACNNVDDNCDGQADEGFDKLGDPRYCESCKSCNWVYAKNAIPGCVQGKCTIATCKFGFVDKNKDPLDGCEYQCTPTGAEVCDGIDNDCNGTVDDGVKLPGTICKDKGPCAGAQATCLGTKGWQCNYDPLKGVELQPCTKDADCGVGNSCDTAKGVCPGIVVADEKLCDGVDGDCDGGVDDPWSNPVLPTAKGKECDLDAQPAKGVCRKLGIYVCDASKTKVACALRPCTSNAQCTSTANPTLSCVGNLCQPKAASPELCNGLDDDCNGKVDDAVTDEKWVKVGSFSIFQYEASRPDSTTTTEGIASDGRPCSVPSRLPWSTVSKEDAQLACERAGARLCTVAEWKLACRGTANTLYPYGATYQPNTCNGRAYDTNPATPANDDAALTTEKPGGACVSAWGAAGSIFNLSGNVKEWTATALNASNKPTGYAIRGGAFDTPSIDVYGAGLSCDYDLPAPTTALQLPTLGFRCCKVP
jgi:hypothetical protein